MSLAGDAAAFRASAASPSLWQRDAGSPAAYELKFVLTEEQAAEVLARLAGKLIADPHATLGAAGAYHTTTLYCDTPALDVYRGVGPYGRRKHRLRRYGSEPWVFLERKSKRGDRVRKRRTTVPAAELGLAAADGTASPSPEWPGSWFAEQVRRHRFTPVCRLAYERTALLAPPVVQALSGPMRITFDRHVRGVLTPTWDLDEVTAGLPVLDGTVVCELKFVESMPALFREVVAALQLEPTRLSKYRTFLRAAGVAAAPASEEGAGA